MNDDKIMELKAQIKEKKAKLKSLKKFTPVTNCSLEFDGIRYNLHVLSKDTTIPLLVKLNMHRLSAVDLGILDDYVISGYKIEEWIADIKAKLDFLSQKEEESKLQMLENKLTALLSLDKKVELELDEIISSLN